MAPSVCHSAATVSTGLDHANPPQGCVRVGARQGGGARPVTPPAPRNNGGRTALSCAASAKKTAVTDAECVGNKPRACHLTAVTIRKRTSAKHLRLFSTDGRCSRGCVAGWGDKFCTTPCNGNTYGPNCSRTCGHCRKVKDSPIAYVTCSRAMGNCSDGCDAGWYNERCDAPCPNGTFGPNCSQICPPCNDTPGCTCNPVTGECNYGLCPVQSQKNKRETLKATLLAVSALLGIVTVAGAVTGTAVLFVHRARAAQRRDEDKSPAEYSTNSSVNAADFTPGGSTGTDYSPDSHDTEDGAP
ncbi:hypothetical protein BaRGS_00023958 [Batillaria attramentaria]|uniref:TNFR-Cys domain-containing protein n=1 Tax=Batillaria attramentaria TaxID=370345 RepID=A0ABD0KCJ3_9CAEN